MAKESFTGLFDNMPSVEHTLPKKPAKKETPPSAKKNTVAKEPEKEVPPAEPKPAATVYEEDAISTSSPKKHSAALPFLKEQKNTEKKNQTFYIPVYLHDRLKESAEMYHMTVSSVLTEILKSVYDEK